METPAKIYVKEIMTKPVQTIDINKTVKEAAVLMDKKNVGSVVITRKGKPVGILTDTDIIRRVVSKGKNPAKTKVSAVMSKPLVTTTPEETCYEAAKKLKKNNIKRLPVITENGKLVGMLSMTDIAVTVPELVELLEYRLKMREEVPTIKEAVTSGICDNCDSYSDDLKYVNDQWLCETCREDLVAER
ncbi:MAG: CBS domain-containing protein [Candidatus Aenigmatarchaeota archaeon]